MNPQGRSFPSLPSLPLWNPPPSSNSSSPSNSFNFGQESASGSTNNLNKNNISSGSNNLWVGPITPPNTNNASIESSNGPLHSLEHAMNNLQLFRSDQQSFENIVSTFKPNNNGCINNFSQQQHSQQQNRNIANNNNDKTSQSTTSAMLEQQHQQILQLQRQLLQGKLQQQQQQLQQQQQQQHQHQQQQQQQSSSTTPVTSLSINNNETPESSLSSPQDLLTQMVMMQQQQLQQGDKEIRQMMQTIQDLRNKIHQVKLARQSDQMIIHRMHLEQEEEQQRRSQSKLTYNNANNGTGYIQQNDNKYCHNPYRINGTSGRDARARNHHHDTNTNNNNNNNRSPQVRNEKCQININALESGTETRTTVMVCNIPNRYTRNELMNELDAKGKCGRCIIIIIIIIIIIVFFLCYYINPTHPPRFHFSPFPFTSFHFFSHISYF